MKAEIRKELLNLWRNHRGASVGLATGTMIAVAMLIFGFWQTVFVLFMAAAGLWLGHEHDIGGDAWLERMLDASGMFVRLSDACSLVCNQFVRT